MDFNNFKREVTSSTLDPWSIGGSIILIQNRQALFQSVHAELCYTPFEGRQGKGKNKKRTQKKGPYSMYMC